jgi:hypothetical protein
MLPRAAVTEAMSMCALSNAYLVVHLARVHFWPMAAMLAHAAMGP